MAKDLKVGDTEIHVTYASQFYDNKGDNNHYQSLSFYDYKNSFGYDYPVGTYTRHIFPTAWKKAEQSI
ncbi:hypothetical protein MHI57_08010 [Cytobacillus sp. FSL K6-0129]|uniref:hypothetical protein n=1 Tax=Cytobacillus sp. FSL K6-0129 TaxID=2921421 RepID=UPI0030F65674